MNNFATIPDYIESFDLPKQIILQKIYLYLRSIVPKEATETISYGMPTFRYHGNLIHFAMNKQHIGVYPGAEAMSVFQDKMKEYKTSKGALQIPLETSIPENLLKEIVDFNVAKLQDKVGPMWHKHQNQWSAENTFMENLLSQTKLKKEFKWGNSIYTYKGKNVIGWGGFKHFFSLWFYYGVFIEDRYGVLISASEGKTKALRQWRFTSVSDMKADDILSYITASIAAIEEGKKLAPSKTEVPRPLGLLLEALMNDNTLHTAFQSITPGRQKEYIEYIDTAKQEVTILSRIEKIKPLILDGKGLNDKYKR